MEYIQLVQKEPEDPKLESPSVYYDEVGKKVHYFKKTPVIIVGKGKLDFQRLG